MINKLKSMRKDSGFTIVELLIVIVVIGILAAITIVSYTGITQKANTTKAQTNAVAVQKVAEAFNADNGYYPLNQAEMQGALATTAQLPAGITVQATAPDATNGTTTIQYVATGASGSVTSAVISYWDFTTGAVSTSTIQVGN